MDFKKALILISDNSIFPDYIEKFKIKENYLYSYKKTKSLIWMRKAL
jgi:hypothetical protein